MRPRTAILALALAFALPQGLGAAETTPVPRLDAKRPVATEAPQTTRPTVRPRIVHRVRRTGYARAGWYDRPPWHAPGVPLGDLEEYGYRPVPPDLDLFYPTHKEVAAPLVGCGRCWGYRSRTAYRRVIHRRVVSVRG